MAESKLKLKDILQKIETVDDLLSALTEGLTLDEIEIKFGETTVSFMRYMRYFPVERQLCFNPEAFDNIGEASLHFSHGSIQQLVKSPDNSCVLEMQVTFSSGVITLR